MDPEEGEAEEEKKGTRRLRWADAENEEGKGAPQSMRKVQWRKKSEVKVESQSSRGICDKWRKGGEHKRKQQRKSG